VSTRDAALQAITVVAQALNELRDDVVFVGGAVPALYSFDDGSVDVRITDDVDCVVELHTSNEYHNLTLALRARGFREDDSPGAPLCRFKIGPVIVDVMPTDPCVLGFSNRWFPDALRTADRCVIAGIEIRVVRPLYFVATKLEAFRDPHRRDSGDYWASRDLEDAIAVLDVAAALRTEIGSGQDAVHQFVRDELRRHRADEVFRDSILGHVAGSATREARLLEWLNAL
jgi:hypothetical protein